jgi:hypothetical protein
LYFFVRARVDAGDIAEMLRLSQDKRIKYIISNRRIASSLVSRWQWRPYNGANAHTHHVHVSVMDTPALYDDPSPWQIDSNTMRIAKIVPEPEVAGAHGRTNVTATVFGGHADRDERSAYDLHSGAGGQERHAELQLLVERFRRRLHRLRPAMAVADRPNQRIVTRQLSLRGDVSTAAATTPRTRGSPICARTGST